MTPDLSPRRLSTGGPVPYAPVNPTDRPQQRDDEDDLDMRAVPLSDDVICPAELPKVAALDQRRKEIDAERKASKGSILDRLKGGAVVQPGRYRATRKVSRSCHLTLGNLEELLGEAFVRKLREKRPVKSSAWLDLRESKKGRAPRGGDFRGWETHGAYQKAFERLVRDLRASDARDQPSPGESPSE
jgi:hypothetical protein